MVKQWARKALAAMVKGAKAGDLGEILRGAKSFEETLASKRVRYRFSLHIHRIKMAVEDADLHEARKSIFEIMRRMPPYTYGEIPAGTAFIINPCPVLMIKRKDGVDVSGLTGRLPHFAGAQVIQPINY